MSQCHSVQTAADFAKGGMHLSTRATAGHELRGPRGSDLAELSESRRPSSRLLRGSPGGRLRLQALQVHPSAAAHFAFFIAAIPTQLEFEAVLRCRSARC